MWYGWRGAGGFRPVYLPRCVYVCVRACVFIQGQGQGQRERDRQRERQRRDETDEEQMKTTAAAAATAAAITCPPNRMYSTAIYVLEEIICSGYY